MRPRLVLMLSRVGVISLGHLSMLTVYRHISVLMLCQNIFYWVSFMLLVKWRENFKKFCSNCSITLPSQLSMDYTIEKMVVLVFLSQLYAMYVFSTLGVGLCVLMCDVCQQWILLLRVGLLSRHRRDKKSKRHSSQKGYVVSPDYSALDVLWVVSLSLLQPAPHGSGDIQWCSPRDQGFWSWGVSRKKNKVLVLFLRQKSWSVLFMSLVIWVTFHEYVTKRLHSFNI